LILKFAGLGLRKRVAVGMRDGDALAGRCDFTSLFSDAVLSA
jgi:hypothetical protein